MPVASSSRIPSTPSSSTHPHMSPSTKPSPRSATKSHKGKEREVVPPSTPVPSFSSKLNKALKSPKANGSKHHALTNGNAEASSSTKVKRTRKGKAVRVGDDGEVVGAPTRVLEVEVEDQADGREAWEWEAVGGEQSENGKGEIPIVFSADGRYYFKASGPRVSIHSTVGPHYPLLTTLPTASPSPINAGHTAAITSLQLHPLNPLQLITSSLDGNLIVWNWVEHSVVRRVEVAWMFEYLAAFKEARKDMEKKAGEREGRKVPGRGIGKVAVGKENGKAFAYASLVWRKAKGSQTRLSQDVIVRIPLRQTALPSTGEVSSRQRTNTYRANLHILGHLPAGCTSLSCSPRGTYLLVLSAKDAFIRKLSVPVLKAKEDDEVEKPKQEQAWLRTSSNTSLTCGAWCPTDGSGLPEFLRKKDEEYFVTGELRGIIKLWNGLGEGFESRKQAKVVPAANGADGSIGEDLSSIKTMALPTTKLHWHAHAVSTLLFNATGTQLLSGGEENVLVTWSLESLKPGFIPRLGSGGICYISIKPTGSNSSEEETWVKLKDGTTMKIGSGTGSITQVGMEVRLNHIHKVSSKLAYPLAFHAQTQSYVLPSSHPSVIQFYQPLSASVLFELEVTPTNRVSRKGSEEVEPVRVESVCFSPMAEDGIAHWMATSESREGDAAEGGGRAKAIKIWEWQGHGYVLNTHLSKAHGLSNLSSLAFGPVPTRSSKVDATLLSTAEDGTAKLWNVSRGSVDVSDAKDSKKNTGANVALYWSLRSTFSYRSLPVTSAAFSPDFSLVALAHGNIATLWETSSNVLLRVLESGGAADGATTVVFLGGAEGGRWLVAAGKERGVSVWDLMAGEVSWTLPSYPISQLLPHPTSSQFLVLSTQSQARSASTWISTFLPASCSPISESSVPQQIISSVISSSASGLELLALDAKGSPIRVGKELAALAKPVRMAASEVAKLGDSSAQTAGMSIWEEMFGKDSFSVPTIGGDDEDALDVNPDAALAMELKILADTKRTKPYTVYDGPAHTLPPASILFESFVEEFMASTIEAEKKRQLAAERAEAGVKEDGIKWESEIDVDGEEAKPAVETAQGRAVVDADVKELGEWFKGLLGGSVNGLPSTVIRMDVDPSDTSIDQSFSNTPSKSTKKGAGGKKAKTPRSSIGGGGAGDVSINGDGQGTPKVGQKRKNVA